MSIEKNSQYMEGVWAAQRVIPRIGDTVYETLEGAVIAKSALIENFENHFGFSREMENPDSNYAMNLGMLDTFKEAYELSKEGSLEDSEESTGKEV